MSVVNDERDPRATVRFVMGPGEAFRAARALRPGVYRLAAIPPIVSFVVGFVMVAILGWPDAAVIAVFLWASALAMAGLYVSLPRLSAALAARRYPEAYREETVIVLDAAGLHATHGAASTVRRWEGISGWTEDRGFITLRHGRLPVAIVPTRAFGNQAEHDRFVAALQAYARPDRSRVE